MANYAQRRQAFIDLQVVRDKAEEALLREYQNLRRDFPDEIEKEYIQCSLPLYWVS